MEKLEVQLAPLDNDTHRVAADLLTFYLLYPSTFKPEYKQAVLSQLIGWKLAATPPESHVADAAFEAGIGSPGYFYSQRRDLQLGYFIAFFREAIRSGDRLTDAERARSLADRVVDEALAASPSGVRTAAAFGAARNIALSLLLPDHFEPIASPRNKQQIVAHWKELAGGGADVDDQLRSIRRGLTAIFGPGFNYYAPEIMPLWSGGQGVGSGRTGESSLDALAASTYMPVEELQLLESLLEKKKHIILYGPPGSGKTFVARKFAGYFADGDEARVEIVQFHQSYGYEDFVQGIRPVLGSAHGVGYELTPGIFRDLCDRVRRTGKRHVLIIDEINRGNVSRIFGELLLTLEYRDIPVRLAGSPPGAESFSIPEDLFIIGTMNTADRSLTQIDYALRRRFLFYRLNPLQGDRAPVLEGWLADQKGLSDIDREGVRELFVALNVKIAGYLGEDFQIGHSYFMEDGIATKEIRDQVWLRSINPLLDEYFYNRPDRPKFVEAFAPQNLVVGEPEVSGATEG